VIREAASVILLRRADPGFEVFFVRRHRGSSFMASAFVFPGGAAEEGEDARTAAARELFEEAGVLLARDAGVQAETLEVPNQNHIRKRILNGVPAKDALRVAGLTWSTDALVPWAHWITPSVEPKRFSARFFVAELPAGQVPKFDAAETVDQTWLAPGDAPARAAELRLPPPQLRTLWELSAYRSIAEVLAAGRARAEEPHPILPRRLPGEPPCLLLPWDPEYVTGGAGDAAPLTYTPSWAGGPSRFVLEDRAWKHVAAPGSTTAG
jgi:8-oxo-dGTP pyrophosphatase MutT (NUDIX family)